mgnify:CR=1 FL=1
MTATTRRRVAQLGAVAVGAVAAPMVVRGQAKILLRIQTHHSAESVPGKIFLRFCKYVEEMSGGRVQIESFTSSAVVKSVETFDAASTGILDGDMTGAVYQPGKDAAFQVFGDMLGGYHSPDQMQAWLDVGGGREIADPLYGKFGMVLVGFWGDPPESLVSIKPLRGLADLEDWKFRCPPAMQTDIFVKLGAKPVVMDFGEVFTALQTKAVEGADAGTLAVNKALGLYEIATYTTYPGFHSMPQDHLAINKASGIPYRPTSRRSSRWPSRKPPSTAGRKPTSPTPRSRGSSSPKASRSTPGRRPTGAPIASRRRPFSRAGRSGRRSPTKQAFESSIAFMKRIGVLA